MPVAFTLLVVLWLAAGPAGAQGSSSLAQCANTYRAGAAAAHPTITRELDAWSRDQQVTLPEAVKDRLVSEYLCVEPQVHQLRPSAPFAELRTVGNEVVRTYLKTVLDGREGNLATTFSRRLGIGGLVQPVPRGYRKLRIVTEPQAATATLDGTDIPGKVCFATVGEHELTAEHRSHLPCRRTFEIAAGNTEVVERCELAKP